MVLLSSQWIARSNETIGVVCECFDVELHVSSIFRSLSRLLTSGKVVARPFLDVQPVCPDPDLFNGSNLAPPRMTSQNGNYANVTRTVLDAAAK
jgi:hypothetical protein